MAPTSCGSCGKSGDKLLRCGRCRNVWFCNRECQVIAARWGHSGVNCRPADGAQTHTAADAEVAPRLPDATGPSTTAPGVDSAPLVPAANSCYACGKCKGKLLRCGRCRGVWFCNLECQIAARNELGHRGANCRAAEEASRPTSSGDPEATPAGRARLFQTCQDLMDEAHTVAMASTRVGSLAAAEKFKEAAAVADLIGGADGAFRRADAEQLRSSCLFRAGDNAAGTRAACSSLRAARASGSRPALVAALMACGEAADEAPGEMVSAERESRKQERLNGAPPSYGGLDISQEGRISLPTTPAALSRLSLAYDEAAVAICDAALAAAGGRDSLTADDDWGVSMLEVEALARSSLGGRLHKLGEERQRSLELLRQALALLRQRARTVETGGDTQGGRLLADQLTTLAVVVSDRGSEGLAEAEACLREALALGESFEDVGLTGKTLRYLINLGGVAHAVLGPAEGEAFRTRLNHLLVQMGRSPETSCSIYLEPLAPPADGAAADAAGGLGSGGAGGASDSSVFVMNCYHQFHRGWLPLDLAAHDIKSCVPLL